MSESSEVPAGTLRGMAVTFVVALVAHPLLGWAWTALAGVAGGWVAPRRGWLVGAGGGSAAWGVLVAWSFAVDAHAVGEMTRVVGTLLGGLPAAATVALTLAIGALLGLGGGLLGAGLRNILLPVAR